MVAKSGMLMEDSSEREFLRNVQKEQERERRRMRDRQRRQSMSSEEREKHLARRRRNYQLRRQRAANARLEPQFNQTTPSKRGEVSVNPSYENQARVSVPDTNLQHNDVGPVVSDAGQKNDTRLKLGAHLVARLPKMARLRDVKHLARFVHRTLDVGDNGRKTADYQLKGNEISSCLPPKGLRFNQVKRLARGSNSDLANATGQDHPIETEGMTEVQPDLSVGDLQLMHSNLPTVGQPSNVRTEDE